MEETEQFLAELMPRQLAAERAFHDGDAGPRKAMWSRRDPVSLMGAAMVSSSGTQAVHEVFDQVATRFSGCTGFETELLAAGASGDLAYTVVLEHTSCSTVAAGPISYRLRVTHVYRREDGEWRTVHRHADEPPGEHRLRL